MTGTTSDRTVAVCGEARALRVRSAGEGRPVVMVPSLGRSSDDFAHLAAALRAAGHRTLLVDPPGIASPLPSRPARDLHEAACDLWEAIDGCGLDEVALVGHAYGNRLVRAASVAHPHRVSALVLLACGGRFEPAAEVWASLARCFDEGLSPPDHRSAVASTFFAPGNDPSGWDDGWWPLVAAQQAAAVGATDQAEIWAGGTAPLLVVQGAQDRVAVPANARDLGARRPDTTVVTIDRCGHAMLPERPDAIADAVVAFLAEHAGG